jgi:hypothetical protein
VRTLVALLVGLVVGSCGALIPVAADESRPERDYADVRCRGNGAEGYRRCRVDFERPAKKVAVDIYIGGEFDIGMVWRPEPGQWKVVR